MVLQRWIIAFLLIATVQVWGKEKPQLRFFCGVTMAKAMLEAKRAFEAEHHCTITIVQGGSKDLCRSIKATQEGDLFLPGKKEYIDQCGEEGYVLDRKRVGYNRMALFVSKGNPKQIRGLDDLLRKDLVTALGNPTMCSIGKMAEEVLRHYKGDAFLKKVQNNLGFYAADSRDMNRMFSEHKIDVGLSWKAAYKGNPDAQQTIDLIALDPNVALAQPLVIGALSFSRHPDLAKAFVAYLASPKGRAIMARYGFGDE
jgi:molybdate transport system substrate-binding protein